MRLPDNHPRLDGPGPSAQASAGGRRTLRAAAAHVLLLGAAVGAFLLVRACGEKLTVLPPDQTAGGGAGAARPGGDVMFHVLLALATVVVAGRILAKLFTYLHQPAVIGEVVAGISLGPSFLGQVAPDVYAYVLPPSVAPLLGVIAQLGVILYMFLIGLELNPAVLRARAHATMLISHASMVVPFVLGAVLALALYPPLAPGGVPFTSFVLFLGVAMAITAFPVLARILTDRRMQRTELGVLALACAAAGDATAWCLLALVVGVVQAAVSGALLVILLTGGYIVFMFLAVRPLAGRLVAHLDEGRLTRGVVAGVFVALLLSALAAEWIGIHALFGAFLLGAVIPHDSAIAGAFTRKLEDPVTILFLPAFFALTGMRTEIGLVAGLEQWLICGLIIVCATAGKFGGTLVAARLTGLGWRQSAALGTLMNTRGLMELIVLNIGLDMGVISPTLFAMMVLMALVTTMATAPVLHWLVPEASPEPVRAANPQPAGLAAPGKV